MKTAKALSTWAITEALSDARKPAHIPRAIATTTTPMTSFMIVLSGVLLMFAWLTPAVSRGGAHYCIRRRRLHGVLGRPLTEQTSATLRGQPHTQQRVLTD